MLANTLDLALLALRERMPGASETAKVSSMEMPLAGTGC